MQSSTTQEEILKLQPRGVLTIPKKFRQMLGLEENKLIRIKKDKWRLVIEPVRTLPYPVRSYTEEDLKEFFEFDAKETKKLKKKGLL